MSGDLNYSGAGALTLGASGSVLNLADNVSHATVASLTLGAGNQNVSIMRTGGADTSGDRLSFNFNTLPALNSTVRGRPLAYAEFHQRQSGQGPDLAD
jgi:hypothetical protein